MSAPRASPPPAARCRASRTPIPSRRGWGSTNGPCRGTGRWRKRPPRWTRRTGRSPAASTPATSTSSWGRPHQERPCASASVSTGSHPARRTEPTPTPTATAPSRSSGCTSSFASPAPSPSAPARSPSPTRALRPTASPSARSGGQPVPPTSFGPVKQVNAGVLDTGYVESGPADGPAVVLLHGWPYDIHSFADVTPVLASAGYRVIVPFVRGYGTTRFLSADTPRNGQQAALAMDVIALMDGLGIGRAIL